MIFELFLKFYQNKILHNFEAVEIFSFDGLTSKKVMAKVDTGADRTSIDESLAKELGLLSESNVIKEITYKSGLAKSQKRPIVYAKFKIKKETINSEVNVVDRAHLKFQILIGRKDMGGFLIWLQSK